MKKHSASISFPDGPPKNQQEYILTILGLAEGVAQRAGMEPSDTWAAMMTALAMVPLRHLPGATPEGVLKSLHNGAASAVELAAAMHRAGSGVEMEYGTKKEPQR